MGAARRPRTTLSELDAWEIATTWLAPLRGKVRLVVDRDGADGSIVDSYAWVRVEPPDARHAWLTATEDPLEEGRERASVVRAAMLVWVALSTCEGYGGRENAVFWRRVFSEYYSKRSVTVQEPRAPSVSDAVEFFDHPVNQSFPRFMVQVNDLYYSEPSRVDPRRVFGLEGHDELSPRIATTVARILTQLEPFMASPANEQTVDVCVAVDTFLMSASSASPYAPLAAFVKEVNSACPRDPSLPRFQIVQFHEDAADKTGNAIHQEGFCQFVQTVPTRLGEFALHQPMLDLTVDDRAVWASSLFRLGGAQASVTSLRFLRHAIDDDIFGVFFSALPFARSVRSITFDTLSCSRNGTFDRRDLPWIAYAFFHPLASQSSCNQLELQHALLTEETVSVLKAMARGNNLLAVLNGTPLVSDAYYSAKLTPGATIHHEPDSASDVMYTAHDRSICVDVCDVSSTDTTSWGEWIAVVRPAYGLGWVRSSQVHSVRTDPPATSHLTGLRLHSGGNRQAVSESLIPVLAVLGASLTYLDLGAYSEVDAPTLAAVLHVCPSLKGLVVHHSGAIWSDSNSILPSNCPLEELELVVPNAVSSINRPASGVFNSHLRCLRALRITSRQPDLLKTSQPAIQQILTTATSLRYFHWRNAARPAKRFYAYDDSRELTQAQLNELQLPDLACQYAHGSTSSNSAYVGFLSVVQETNTAGTGSLSALTQPIHTDVLATIFQFAARPKLHAICIEPGNNKQPDSQVDVTWFQWIHDGLKALFIAPS